LVLVIVGLAVSSFLLWREKEQTQNALAEAQANHTQAEAQRRRAETNFRQAYWTLEDMLCAFDPDRNSQPLSIAELRQWQTDTALRFLAPFCEDPSEEPAVRLQKGAAYVHAGRVHEVLGDREKARNAFHQAVAVFDRLVHDFPDDPTYPRELAMALGIIATDLYQAGQIADANGYYRQAVSAWREAIRNHAADLEACLQLACFQCLWFDRNLRDPAAAVELARKAVEMAPHDPEAWMVLGIAYYRMDLWSLAVNAFQEGFQRASIRQFRQLPWTKSLFFLAVAQSRCGKHEEAMESYQEAIRLMANNRLAGGDALNRAARAEAAAALGIQETPTPKAKEESPRKD
jgi:tetratricopeptide (TPR) repeat protein